MEIHPIDKIVIESLMNSKTIRLIDLGSIEYLKKILKIFILLDFFLKY